MKLSFLSIGLVLVIAGSLWAGPVTVNNPSFENPALACAPSNECWQSGSITGWTPSGVWATFKPGPAQVNSVPDGSQILGLGFDGSGEVDQDTLTQVVANTTYTLSVMIGRRIDFGMSDYSIGLLGLQTQSDTVSPTAGNFLLDTLVFTSGGPGDPNIGKEIVIQLTATITPPVFERQTDFDSVSLDATTSVVGGSAPEPSAFVLAGLGLLPLALLRRRR
jgi:hypothetical protein